MQVAAEPVERDMAGRLSQLERLQYELTRQVRVLGAVKHKKNIGGTGADCADDIDTVDKCDNDKASIFSLRASYDFLHRKVCNQRFVQKQSK